MGVVSDAVLEDVLAFKSAIADGHRLECVVGVDEGAAALADDAVAGNADAQPGGHSAASPDCGVR